MHDPAIVEDVRAWLARAAADLRAGEVDLAASPPLLEDVLFHCQQAAEKALKAFLAWHDLPFRKTHSLEEIGRQCIQLDPSLEGLVDRVAPLTEFAWKFRYPGEAEPPLPGDASSALDLAREAYEAILARLPEGAVRSPT
ncbi:MAG: HEPN domain-containing protein [Thermoanaerobaculia bacterium]